VTKPFKQAWAALAATGLVTAAGLSGPAVALDANPCPNPAGPVAVGAAQWNGWGRDLENSRYQPEPAIRAADVPKLRLKWAYGYQGNGVYGQPTVVDGRLFVTSSSGRVYALDARTGCTYWTFDAAAAARTAVTVGELAEPRKLRLLQKLTRHNAHIDVDKPPSAVFFGDDSGAIYALDAQRGSLLWKTQADAHPLARITGSPTLYRDRLYVPVSSSEEDVAANPAYGCCTFRGSLVALDIASGQILWKTFTATQEAKPYRTSQTGVQQFGPAGMAVWSAPTIDTERGLVYAATGNSTTGIAQPMSDAIVALDLRDGRVRWTKQAGPEYNEIATCKSAGAPSCPEALGFDGDFSASPILRGVPAGRQILLAGQKSGIVYGLNPDREGDVLWQDKIDIGNGPVGVLWGLAADYRNVYAAVAPAGTPATNTAGGLVAIEISTGRVRWTVPAPTPMCSWGPLGCSHGQAQAVTVMPGIVFSGSVDGHLRAYSTIDGKIVWDFDTAKAYAAVNGVTTSGGSLDHGGPTIVNGMLYVNSGYGKLAGHPGNALLAFSVDGK
jgi:polyvinyl alcohol dehydrogenase (cytochrome)